MNCLMFLTESRYRVMLGRVCLASLFCMLVSMGSDAWAAQPLLTADKISYDEKTDIITAIGNVELAQEEHVLRADKIIYYKKKDVAKAIGNIALVSQKTGEILYAKEMEVTSDMKEAFIQNLSLLFPDNSRLMALDAQRYEGRYLVAEHAVYSACNLCKANPKAAPIWQIRAVRAIHDQLEKNVVYRNATIDFWGVPVFYTPYFSHPDPSVTRRQGFLAPIIGMDSTLGAMTQTPYYFDLAPNSDLLLTPTISEEDFLQANALWRHKFRKGNLEIEGSMAYAHYTDESGNPLGKKWRGHLFANSLFNISREWRVGGKIAYASDKGYMNRYDISSDDLLVNRIYAEHFTGRNYSVGNLFYFQDMRPGTLLVEPIIAPEIRYSAIGEPAKTWGGRWAFDSSLLVTSRDRVTDPDKQGPSTRRLALKAGWERQLVSRSGFLTTVAAHARADAYWANNVANTNDPALTRNFASIKKLRPFIQGDITIRYPLGRHSKGYEQILEPIAVLSLAPRVRNNLRLPNEDSLDVEFDETNLFTSNRFSGIDRVEGGSRAAYGLRHALFGKNGEHIKMLVGQVFRLQQDDTFTRGSGLHEQFSDFVGRIDVTPAKWLNVNYGFRLNQKDLSITRQEFEASLGKPIFQTSLKYLSLKQSEGSSTVDQRIQEATGSITSNFTKYWTISTSHKRAIAPMPGPRTTSFNLTYQDECFKSDLSISRDYTTQVDVESGMTILLNIYIKNLGGMNANY